jgi:hypothetical protein
MDPLAGGAEGNGQAVGLRLGLTPWPPLVFPGTMGEGEPEITQIFQTGILLLLLPHPSE